MRSNMIHKIAIKALVGTTCLFIYCEYLIYYVVLYGCEWPTLDPRNADRSIENVTVEPVKAMIIADTHLLGSRRGHWFDKLRREWQMSRTFKSATFLHQPDVVFVLGDLFDEGAVCSPDEFEYYVDRLHSLFPVPKGTRMYFAVGNHDIGFHYRISPYLNERFEKALKTPSIQMITLRGNHFVLINSMALEGDGCFLCKPAEKELTKIENILKCSRGENPHHKCDNKLANYSRPILMQHFPLYRDSDKDCDDFDAAPLPILHERFREGWDCLSRGATRQILRQIQPRLALSGHTHHGCTRRLPTGDGVEITIPSFSWRNKDNPTYGLAVFAPDNYSFFKCAMPKESTVINMYIFGVALLYAWLMYSYFSKRQARYKFKVR